LPVRIAARTASSLATRSTAALNCARISSSMALRTSGRLSAIVATPASIVSSTFEDVCAVVVIRLPFDLIEADHGARPGGGQTGTKR
jgi:hypothetical protein